VINIFLIVVAPMQAYIHKTNNRLRIRSDYIFEHRKEVVALIEKLHQIEGVLQIKHKKHAGSVAITFCDKSLTQEALLETVSSHGWLQESKQRRFVENAARKGTKSLVKGALLLAAKKTLGVGVVSALAAI